jgi:glycosyl transferase family 87
MVTIPAVASTSGPADAPLTRVVRVGMVHSLARRLAAISGLALLAAIYARYLQSQPSSDWLFYYHIVSLAERGLYPFVNYWSEYPPLFPMLLVGTQRIAGHDLWSDQATFSQVYIAFMSAIYLANLVLVWDLVRIAHSLRAAWLALILYAACPLIAWFTVGWFDGVAVLLLLLGMRALVARQAQRAGFLIGLGILTKVFPGVLLLAAPGILGWRRTLRMTAMAGGVLAAVLLALVIVRADLLWATALSIMTRPAWETLPALLGGNYLYGLLPPAADRFSVESARSDPTVTSGLAFTIQALTAVLAVVAAWYQSRRCTVRPADAYALVAFGITMLLLGSKGFSPQYLLWILPLILLVWPNRVGAFYILAISVYGYCYYQFWFHDIVGYFQLGNVALDQLVRSAWLSVAIRTALLLILAAHLVLHTYRGAGRTT